MVAGSRRETATGLQCLAFQSFQKRCWSTSSGADIAREPQVTGSLALCPPSKTETSCSRHSGRFDRAALHAAARSVDIDSALDFTRHGWVNFATGHHRVEVGCTSSVAIGRDHEGCSRKM